MVIAIIILSWLLINTWITLITALCAYGSIDDYEITDVILCSIFSILIVSLVVSISRFITTIVVRKIIKKCPKCNSNPSLNTISGTKYPHQVYCRRCGFGVGCGISSKTAIGATRTWNKKVILFEKDSNNWR